MGILGKTIDLPSCRGNYVYSNLHLHGCIIICVLHIFLEGEASSISNDAIPDWVEKMADNWFNFGVALGFSEEDLQSIKDSNDDDVARCSAMMYRWLSIGDRREKTHERLLRAAKEAAPAVVPNGMSPEPPPYSGTNSSNTNSYSKF